MKFWKDIVIKDLSFEKAKEQIQKFRPYYSTRPMWDGVHFYSKHNQYCILLKDGALIINTEDIWGIDMDDWMIVTITDEAVRILKDNNLI